jgi:uncharacterized membrane protein YqaE (UPF0057 family)
VKRNLLLLFICLNIILPAQVFSASLSKTPQEAAKEVSAEPAIGALQDAMKEFRSLSRKERKEKLKDVKSQLKHYKAEQAAGREPVTNTLLLVIIAILLPPLAVYLHQGEINNKFWIALLLTILLYLPGLIYALVTILS